MLSQHIYSLLGDGGTTFVKHSNNSLDSQTSELTKLGSVCQVRKPHEVPCTVAVLKKHIHDALEAYT